MMEYRTDILYVLLYARGKSMMDNEPIKTRNYLQREMFLLQLEKPFTSLECKYRYKTGSYDPYSGELLDDLLTGVEMGFINEDHDIFLTSQGVQHAVKSWSIFDCPFKQTAIHIKEEYNGMEYKELLAVSNEQIQKIKQIPNWLK